MPFQPVPQTYGVEIRGTNNGVDVENTLYYRYAGDPSETDATVLADTVAVQVLTDWVAQLPTSWVGREVYVRDLATEITVQATSALIAGVLGTAVGEPLASLLTIAIARRSGLTGRSARGRLFWMGLSEAMTTGNIVTSGALAAIVSLIENMDATVETGLGLIPVIVSRYTGSTLRPSALTLPIAQWLATDDVTDTRRSRKPTA